ncbi:MAG: hypothetical protein JSR99_14385 [Proteobacteria bacterium]|nr:hypothetical protein [Pseudomonadota bacterium]
MIPIKAAVLAPALLALEALPVSAGAAPVIGWVEVTPVGKDHISVVGHASATTDTAGQFSLLLIRKSASGAIRTGQTGNFKATAGEAVVLSKTEINVGSDEDIAIELKLSVAGKEVSIITLKTGSGPAERAL